MRHNRLKFDAAHWRERAREMRAFAEKAGDEETAHRMLRVAADYDKLAERAEAADSEPPDI
jgi:DNA-binding ferritin-like protein